MGNLYPIAHVGCNKFQLEIMGKKLAASTVGKHKTIVLKALCFKVMPRHLLQERSHWSRLQVKGYRLDVRA